MGQQIVRSTVCPQCGGAGVRHVPRGIIRLGTGEVDTVMVAETCQACDGEGRRPGFQPPV